MPALVKFALVSLASFSDLCAAGQDITTPRSLSPAATVSQTIGISTITVIYSRPSVRGREIWGGLVPFGWNSTGMYWGYRNIAPWRSGANENTTIQISHDAKVEGQLVPAGLYGLFFVINQDNSGEVILSKDNHSWGHLWYKPERDQMRAKIQLHDIPHTELLTFDFVNITENSTDLVLSWEKKQFPVKIEFAVNDIVLANAEEELKGPKGTTWQGYASAARYILQNKLNYEQGLRWIDSALKADRNFTTLQIKSALLEATGKKEEAENTMAEAVTNATEYDSIIMLILSFMRSNTTKLFRYCCKTQSVFLKAANAWDSLGEGYALKGDKKNAILSFKKSLTLNPSPAVKENSEKYLKSLGAL
jgi:hypothetical protein